MIQKWILDNGVNLLLDPVDTTDTVSVGFWFLQGSRDEEAGISQASPQSDGSRERGYSHFLEHMLFKGTETRSAFEIAKAIDRVGGVLNAFTERECTCYYATLPREHLPLAIEILSDMVYSSVLSVEEIEREKSVVLNEIYAAMDSPEELAHEAYLSGNWGSHPLALKITGEVEDIQGITRNTLEAFYRKRYVPANLVISIAGRFESRRAFDLVAGRVQSETGPSWKHTRKVPEKKYAWNHRPDRFKQVHIYTGTDLPLIKGLQSPLYNALVFSNAVGESMSSRLFQEIREKRALCYSISSYRSLYTDISLWTVYSNTTPAQVPQLIQAINDELGRLLTDPLTHDEIEDAKSYLKGSLILAKEDMETRMKRLVRMYTITGEVLEYEESLRYIAEVSEEGVWAIAREAIQSKRFNLVAYGGSRIKGFKGYQFTF
ncbi:MAG TPA: pitrilysin family protein [Spirochaetia bacterium]|nr:pitrilysin family protein [Spirochaetia bacterium]